jgi:polyhydroxybutyrate depolymerase
MQLSVICIVLVFPAILIYLFIFVLYSGENLKMQAANVVPLEKVCGSVQKIGLRGESRMRTVSGFAYLLKTPTNYDENLAWPVLIVFSPMMSGGFMEYYTGLTASLTRAGFLIAYVDAVPMNLKTIPKLTEVISSIDANWCMDKEKVFLAGHSDGATIAQALNFLPESGSQIIKIAGFVSSAAGLQKQDLQQYACPEATQVMLLHNIGDDHFVDFGKGAAEWWAECNQCTLPAIENTNDGLNVNGCYYYEGCREGGDVIFCEQPGNHLKWPERHEEIVNFLTE